MRSAVLKETKKIVIEEINEPVSDGNRVLINVLKNGICGSDLHNFEAGAPSGLVMGHEYCGVVLDPGSREDLKVGDRVTALPISPCGHCDACNHGNPQFCIETWTQATGLSLDNPGGLAPKMLIRPDMVIKVPDTISDNEVAMVEPAAVGLHAIHLADINVGEKVLVVGAGIIGLVSAMFAKKEGASYVAVTETNEYRGNKSVELGVADEWFNPMDENTLPTLMSKTNGGFDKVIECVGNAPAVTSSLMMCKPGGKVILVGVSNTPIAIPTVLAVLRELDVKGAIAYTREEFQTVIDLLDKKQIELEKFVDKVVPLDETQSSFDELISGTGKSIKILVDPNK